MELMKPFLVQLLCLSTSPLTTPHPGGLTGTEKGKEEVTVVLALWLLWGRLFNHSWILGAAVEEAGGRLARWCCTVAMM